MDTTTTPDADLPELPPGDIRFDGRRLTVGDVTPAPGRHRIAGTDVVLEVADAVLESDEEHAARIAAEE